MDIVELFAYAYVGVLIISCIFIIMNSAEYTDWAHRRKIGKLHRGIPVYDESSHKPESGLYWTHYFDDYAHGFHYNYWLWEDGELIGKEWSKKAEDRLKKERLRK